MENLTLKSWPTFREGGQSRLYDQKWVFGAFSGEILANFGQLGGHLF